MIRQSLAAAALVLVGCGSDAPTFVDEPETATADTAVDDATPDGAETTVAVDSTADGELEAAVDAGGDSACTVAFYKDEDGDGVGGATKVTACTAPPGHVMSTGDCRDDNKDVRPGATEYRTVGYASTAPISPTSFDYDCNGKEDRDPTRAVATAGCTISGVGCAGEGYLPVMPARTGAGVDNHCGSTRFRKCERKTVPPSCTATEIVAPTAMACR